MGIQIYRHVILAITLVCMTMLIGNSVLFQFTVICMNPEDRGANWLNESRFYTPGEEGWLIAASPIGLILGTLPAIFMADKIGMRLSFTIFGVISGTSTVGFPLLTTEIYGAVFSRFIQGVAMASAFVAIGNVPIDYGGVEGKALFLSLLSCSYQLGPITATPSSAAFCGSSHGWQGVHYLFGLITLLSFVVFVVVYRDITSSSRSISTAKVVPTSHRVQQTSQIPPYKDIFMSPSVWGTFSTGIGDALAFLLFFYYGPIYVNKVLHFEIEQTGILAALPYLVSMIAKILTGLVLHKTTYIQSANVVYYSNILLQAFLTMNFLVLIFLAADRPMLAEVLIVLTVAIAGVHFIAIMSAAQIIARQYTHVISSAMAALESFFGLLLAPFVSLLAPNHTADEWKRVFYCITAFLIATNVIFAVLTKLKPAKWTENDRNIDKFEMKT